MGRDEYSMLEKVALVLGAFPDGRDLSLVQLVERTGLARSTVHRLLVEVTELGWVDRVGPRFALGTGLFELGERVPVKQRLRARALPFMQDLFVVTGETVHLAVRDGVDALYVEKIHGHGPLTLPSRIGGRAPLTCTAVGKALLAHEEPASVEALLARPMRRLTPRSITDPGVLRDELGGVRRTGLAVEREEAADGGACVAAPVLVDGRPVGALSVSVPVERFAPERLGPAVLAAAGGLVRLPRVVPPAVAHEMVLTGRRISADEAQRWGIVNRVAPAGGALAAARELAAELLAASPTSIRLSLRMMREAAAYADPVAAVNAPTDALDELMVSHDALEGIMAFVEKRPPQWMNH